MSALRTVALLSFWLPAASSVSLDLDPAKTEVQFTLHDVLHTARDPSSFLLKVEKTVEMDIKTTLNAEP